MELPIDNQQVLVESHWWRFDKVILQARMIGNKVLIIFDYMAYPNVPPAPNLVAYDQNQKELWIAENPGGGAAAYVNFISEEPLKVWNFSCFICTLDPKTGKLLEAEFTK
ncbi:MAG TPA: hypothetical protein PLA50_17905 [Bacteroidia bacterium]|nr:hypothetical protein [Bacteroidia bacterium]